MALVIKNLPANAGDTRDVSLIPGLGRSPGVGNDNRPQYSCLENSMDRGAYRAMSYEITKNQTSLSLSLTHRHTHTHTHTHTQTQLLKKARNSEKSLFSGLEDSLYSDFHSDTEEDIQLLRQIKYSY